MKTIIIQLAIIMIGVVAALAILTYGMRLGSREAEMRCTRMAQHLANQLIELTEPMIEDNAKARFEGIKEGIQSIQEAAAQQEPDTGVHRLAPMVNFLGEMQTRENKVSP